MTMRKSSPLDFAMGPQARAALGAILILISVYMIITKDGNWPIGQKLALVGGGLMLIASSVAKGWRMSLFALPAAGVAVLGRSLGLPAPSGFNENVLPILVGCVILSVGFFWNACTLDQGSKHRL